MKHPSQYTLILLAVFLHSSSSSGSDDRCVPLFVSVEATAVINCPVSNGDQDGVYLYRQLDENSNEDTVMYYYKDGTLSPEPPFKHRLETNENFGNFSVSLKNVSKHDGGVYWCLFNKLDHKTRSERTCLLVQSGTIVVFREESDILEKLIFRGVIGGLSFFILLLLIILAKLCHDRGNYTPKQQASSNGVYEVMRGNTGKALINPEYESTRR
ncbi:hypothetical protein QTP86_031619 [Hemibagrus guttatus]|nr:hypothetical protein QTP86_031619 [Hemibagrus guttatus]